MPTTLKVLASIIGIAGLIRLYWSVSFEGSQAALEERFPHIDPSIVREVHKEIIRETFRGNLKNVDIDNEAAMDALFMRKVMSRP